MIFEFIPGFAGLNEYIKSAIVLFILFLVLRVALYLLTIILLKLSSKTKTDLDDVLIKKSSAPLSLLSLLIALYFSFAELTFVESVGHILYKSLYSLIAISVGYVIFVIVDNSLIRLWKKISEKTESNIDDTIGGLVHEVLRIVLIMVIVIFILNIWGVEITPLLAGLGIAGLAVALALQPALSNVFSGIAIIMDGTFKIGDVIKFGENSGEVYKIGLRTTRIKTFDNDLLIIPNSEIANSTVQNFFQPDISVRVNLEFGVEYGVDPEYVKKITIEEIEKIKFIDKKQEIRVLFTSMGDSALDFKAMFWVDHISKKWPAHQEAISRVYRRLYKEQIGIPYPQSTVWIRDEGKAKSPDPSNKKFKKVYDKYYAAFGHEYKEKVEEKKEEKEKKNLFKKLKKIDKK